MLTCKDFLSELSDYLDETIDAELRAKLENHITECPNCWVIADTTRKTIQIYKGMEPYPIPPKPGQTIRDRRDPPRRYACGRSGKMAKA